MFRALLEGIMMQIKLGSNNICQSLGMTINELYIGGGGSKSNVASQVIADMFNVPVYRVKESENCSLGAAMCAAVGSSVYANLDGAISAMVKKYDEFQPNAKSHEFYEALSAKVIQKLYPAMADVLKELAELTTAKS
jgi:sugar (pentulose or hexulose) kinase